jgi:APA family basic amino acid/polyamine antiporter
MSRDGLCPKPSPGFTPGQDPNYHDPSNWRHRGPGCRADPISISSEIVSIAPYLLLSLSAAGCYVLRRQHPEYNRPFKVPMYPFLPAVGALLCAFLMISLPGITWIRFVVWLAAGLSIYFFYGQRHSRLDRGIPASVNNGNE